MATAMISAMQVGGWGSRCRVYGGAPVAASETPPPGCRVPGKRGTPPIWGSCAQIPEPHQRIHLAGGDANVVSHDQPPLPGVASRGPRLSSRWPLRTSSRHERTGHAVAAFQGSLHSAALSCSCCGLEPWVPVVLIVSIRYSKLRCPGAESATVPRQS